MSRATNSFVTRARRGPHDDGREFLPQRLRDFMAQPWIDVQLGSLKDTSDVQGRLGFDATIRPPVDDGRRHIEAAEQPRGLAPTSTSQKADEVSRPAHSNAGTRATPVLVSILRHTDRQSRRKLAPSR